MSAHLEPFGTQMDRDDFLRAVMKFPPGGRRDRGLIIHRRMEQGIITSEELVTYALSETMHMMAEFADMLHEAADDLEKKA